jgi:hypothetical protein
MNDKITISYAITVCNELVEITTLLNFLQLHIGETDEIVVQYDTNGVTPEVLDYLNLMGAIHKNHTIIGFPLNNDFASFKNNLKSHCNGIYIFQLDADEQPHQTLVENLSTVLETNPVDLVFVPRINTVDGIELSHVEKYRWKITKIESDALINEKIIDTDSEEYKLLKHYDLIIEETDNLIKYYRPVNQFPDYQTRIYRNTPDVEWMNRVHERITGYNTFSNFPAKEEWSLFHHKNIKKQEYQNLMYSNINEK